MIDETWYGPVVLPLTQETEFQNQMAFRPVAIENALDKVLMLFNPPVVPLTFTMTSPMDWFSIYSQSRSYINLGSAYGTIRYSPTVSIDWTWTLLDPWGAWRTGTGTLTVGHGIDTDGTWSIDFGTTDNPYDESSWNYLQITVIGKDNDKVTPITLDALGQTFWV